MATTRTRKHRPGYEPAKGFPDPAAVPVGAVVDRVTHYPAAQGPVCAMRPPPTQAEDYDPQNPTCEACAKWLAAARKNTARMVQKKTPSSGGTP